MLKYLVLLVFLSTGCAHDGSPGQEPEASTAAPGTQQSDLHPCTDTNNDFYNCGRCGYICPPPDADVCVGGECKCGRFDPCDDGEDCRYGRCILPDPEGAVCEFDPECIAISGSLRCIEGRCTFVVCSDEECNGLDDDCDGQIDEGSDGAPLSEWCYNGPDDIQDIKPPCRPGVRICADGEWLDCIGNVDPIDEQGLLACDGEDNNCDGCIDGIMGEDGICQDIETNGFDILFLIDDSGSMVTTIEAVIEVTSRYSGQFAGNQNFRFALITFPGDEYPGSATVRKDFADLEDFLDVLSLVEDSLGADEGNWDVVYEVGTGEIPLSWTPGSVRIIIEFTDEAGQSYRLPSIGEEDMCNALVHGEVVVFFTYFAYAEDFDLCGERFDISDADTMEMNLRDLISDPCL